jgi:ankyrin repeat protein
MLGEMDEALQALYEGDAERGEGLLPPDDRLDVFTAAAFGRLERLEQLLRDDPGLVAAFSADGFTALHLAVFGRRADAARLLLDRGADVNVRSTGPIARVPPLGTAAFVGSVALARLLLARGADVNGEGEGGFTALDSALRNGDDELVRLLESRGGARRIS